jgi:hypothetical protein
MALSGNSHPCPNYPSQPPFGAIGQGTNENTCHVLGARRAVGPICLQTASIIYARQFLRTVAKRLRTLNTLDP